MVIEFVDMIGVTLIGVTLIGRDEGSFAVDHVSGIRTVEAVIAMQAGT